MSFRGLNSKFRPPHWHFLQAKVVIKWNVDYIDEEKMNLNEDVRFPTNKRPRASPELETVHVKRVLTTEH